MGFGGGGVKPINNSDGGMKPGQVLRRVDFERERRLSRTGVKSALASGVLNVKRIITAKQNNDGMRKGEKNITHQKLKEENVIDLMRKKYIGKTEGQIERMIDKEKGVIVEDGKERIQYEMGRKDRKIFDNIVTGGEGPSREEIAADEKKHMRFQRLNILGVQRSREKDDMASQLSAGRQVGEKNVIKTVLGKGGVKTNYTDLGINNPYAGSGISALAGKNSTAPKNVAVPGFAGTVQTDKKEPDSVVSPHVHVPLKSI